MGDRFSIRYDANSIDHGISDQQGETGTTIQWWFYRADQSVYDGTYPEGSSTTGRRWHGPYAVPVYAVTRIEGEVASPTEGFETFDTTRLWISAAQARRAGLLPSTDRTNVHLKDRFVWDGKIWQPGSIITRNLIKNLRRMMIVIQATEVTESEIVNDVDFLNLNLDGTEHQYLESGL